MRKFKFLLCLGGLIASLGLTVSATEPLELLELLKPSVPVKTIEPLTHDIPWSFYVYAEPDFQSQKLDQFNPQTITILEQNDDGWASIETHFGSAWVYLNAHKIYLDIPTSLYEDMSHDYPVDSILPQLVRVLEQHDKWILIETWLGEKWIDLTSIRYSVLLDVPVANQRSLGYPTGCEIIALSMLINEKMEVDPHVLVSEMPRSDHPKEGFRGNPRTTGGFTVFPPALLALTESYLGSAHDMSGSTMDDLRFKLNENKPVVVWVNGFGFNVHAVCLTGYDAEGFYYNDPWTGRKDAYISFDSFYAIWDKPIIDRRLNLTYSPRKALSY